MPEAPICAWVFRIFAQPLCDHFGKVGLKSGRSETPGQIASVGVPNFWKILKAVSISESPAKSGAPVAISARMHPTPHMSTGMLYSFEPSSISSGLYQTVITSCVYWGIGREKATEEIKPKGKATEKLTKKATEKATEEIKTDGATTEK